MHATDHKSTDLGLPCFRPDHIIVSYDEIALKGNNRNMFENRLKGNIRAALRDIGGPRVRRIFGRLLLEIAPDAPWQRFVSRLQRVFGVSRISPARRTDNDLEAVKRLLTEALRESPRQSFAIVSRRVNKRVPFRSNDANRELGAHVQSLTGWPVNLSSPELPIHVTFLDQGAFVAFARLEGPGGLPSGSTGKVVCLLSGGIDSPVASYQILRRGADAVFAHFHSFPHTDAASQDKVRELAGRVLPPGQRARLHMIPFAELQHRIVSQCPDSLRVILYRRFMLRIAERIARRANALALVTGDSLGQVASQTLENLHSINRVATLPVLRPLIGTHKREIVAAARRLGTFETSIEPHDDCCSLLMPRHPATHSTPEELESAETALDVETEIEKALAASSVETICGATL